MLQVVENWYPGKDKENKGVVLVVTAGKEGAISGGDKFLGVSAEWQLWLGGVQLLSREACVHYSRDQGVGAGHTAPATRSAAAILQPFLGGRPRLCHTLSALC